MQGLGRIILSQRRRLHQCLHVALLVITDQRSGALSSWVKVLLAPSGGS
jgi:hypothetical protein